MKVPNAASEPKPAMTDLLLARAEGIVADWLSENQDRFADGGVGDVADLLARLSPILEKAPMSASSSKLTADLHHLGLCRQETTIAAVNVSCGGESIGLLVQDAKGYAAIQLGAEEAAHIAALLSDSVTKLQESGSRPE